MANDLFEEVVAYRRHIHAYPELGNEEVETSKYIQKILNAIGIKAQSGIGGYGVMGLIEGTQGPGKCIAIRADIDALPIQEETGLAFSSSRPGIMHACGHDMHTAILLGCARMLYALRDQFSGTVKLIFQPAEEVPDGGAESMIKDGVLEHPKVDAAIALHMETALPTGRVAVKDGHMTAASAHFHIILKGKGGHAAIPQETIDPVVMAAEAIMSMQQIVSRKISPNEPCVVSIGKITGGTVSNQIPESVELEGTCRAFRSELMEQLRSEIDRVLQGVTLAHGGSYDFEYEVICSPVTNDTKLFHLIVPVIKQAFGENLLILNEPITASEDFGFFCAQVPSLYMQLGCREEGRPVIPPHNSAVVFDEKAIPAGMELMAKAALAYLKAVDDHR